MNQNEVVAEFHRLYYALSGSTWESTFWLGTRVLKCPLDLWVYQELLTELRPELIVETGTAAGGSALFLASICDLLGKGTVVTIDVRPEPARPTHPRITYLVGSSIAEPIVAEVRRLASSWSPVLVILDSDHRREHVAAELAAYAPLVSQGSYVIVEDTNIHGHPVLPEFGEGPMEAVAAFLATTTSFEVDGSREKFLLTFNPRGFLRRVR